MGDLFKTIFLGAAVFSGIGNPVAGVVVMTVAVTLLTADDRMPLSETVTAAFASSLVVNVILALIF